MVTPLSASHAVKAIEINSPPLSVLITITFTPDCISTTGFLAMNFSATLSFVERVIVHEYLVKMSSMFRMKREPPRLCGVIGPARSMTMS